jgi:PAS domain S-box-containing protein
MQTSVDAPAEAKSPKSSPPKLPTIPELLVRLVLACLLPALLGLSLMIYVEYQHSLAQQLGTASLSVRDKLIAVDAELAQAELVAQSLALETSLSPVNFASFHQKSVRLLREFKLDYSVLLIDANGQQLLNTRLPYGTLLGKQPDKDAIESVFATGQKVGSTFTTHIADGLPKVLTLTPIFSGPTVVYALAVGFLPSNLNRLLERPDLQGETVISIIDNMGTIAASSHEAQALVGEKANSQLLERMQTQTEGAVNLMNSGIPYLVNFKRSTHTGWAVAIGTPLINIRTPLTDDFLLKCGAGLLLLGLSLFPAWLVGRRITKSLRSLHDVALALGSSTLVEIPNATLRETNELSEALKASALRLVRRTQQLLVANEALKERSAELDEAQKIAKIGNWKWEANTGIIFASDELRRLYGQKIFLPFSAEGDTMFTDESWQELKEAARAALQNKTGFSLRLRTLTEDGNSIWSQLIGEAVCNETGAVTGLRGTLQDVDFSTKATLSIQDNVNRYQTLFNESLDAVVIQRNEKVVFTNSSALTLFGAAAEADLVGKSLSQFVHLDFYQPVAASFSAIIKGDQPTPPIELKFVNLQGQPFSAHVRCTEFTFNGECYVQTHMRDLKEQKRKDAEIAHLQAEMHDVLVWQVAQHTVAALAHEVNQPLASAAILCAAVKRMLVSGVPAHPASDAESDQAKRIKDVVSRIESDIERAGEVLRNLLDSVDKPDITRANANMAEIIAESILSAKKETDIGYKIITDHGAGLPAINVNRLQVVKVLLNLIHNAVQSMHGAQNYNGTIWVSSALSADGSEIFVSVRDEGPGISVTLQQEVFQPFITTKPNGLGMGLTISRALIEAHGGKLWHKQDDSPGATFIFTLPTI